MSGWRAGLIALALGGVVLTVGWFLNRDTPPTSTTTDTGVVGADITLACPEAFRLACDELAARLSLGRATHRTGQAIEADTVVIDFAADLGELAPTVFARSPIAIAVIGERATALERACGRITVACLIENGGRDWADLDAPSSWGKIGLGLADPTTGIADLEAWRIVAAADPPAEFGASVRLRAEDVGDMMLQWAQITTRADAVVAVEVAIAGQLENFINRAGRLEVFYPDPTPYVQVAAYGQGRAARGVVDQLNSPDIQAMLGSLGLRPLTGEAQGLLDGLGIPLAEMTQVSPGEAVAFVAKWDLLVGG